jgi:hypothetical protein
MSFIDYRVKESEMINTLNEKVFNEDKIKKTFDQFNKVDCHNQIYVIELKFRNMPSTQYNDCFIEQAKYDALMERAETANKIAGYIAAYTDGKYYAWNLTEMTKNGFKFNWKPFAMKATTHFEHNDQVLKMSCKLPISEAKCLI